MFSIRTDEGNTLGGIRSREERRRGGGEGGKEFIYYTNSRLFLPWLQGVCKNDLRLNPLWKGFEKTLKENY